jgi:DNA repair ATPase RecN
MISSIKISGFQSHKDTTLALSPGVNFLLGQSDSGKSAIIRALLWVFQNRPGGDSFVSTFANEARVEVVVDGHTVVRLRNKTTNCYSLDGLVFNAIGTDVPKEILDVLNVGNENVNRQLDAPYLLSMSPGETASHFNAIANLTKIDTGTQKVNSSIRELTADIKYKESQETKLLSDIDTYAHLSIFESEVQELEELEKKSVALDASFRKLYQWQATYYEIKTKIEYHQKTLELEKPLNVILNLIEERAKKDIEEVKLDRTISQIKDVQIKINEQSKLITLEKPISELLQLHKDRDLVVDKQKRLSMVITNLKSIQVRIIKEDALSALDLPLTNLLGLIEQRNKAEESKLGLSRITSSLRTIQTRIINGDIWIKKNEAEFEKEIGSVCPLCNQPIKHNHK